MNTSYFIHFTWFISTGGISQRKLRINKRKSLSTLLEKGKLKSGIIQTFSVKQNTSGICSLLLEQEKHLENCFRSAPYYCQNYGK